MPQETTLVLIKPHAVADGHVNAICRRYHSLGLRMDNLEKVCFTTDLASRFYEEHQGRPFFPMLVEAMCEGPLVAIVISGEDAIRKVWNLNGKTNPDEAVIGTIRRDFKGSGGPRNTVHGSDSAASAAREIALIWPKKDN